LEIDGATIVRQIRGAVIEVGDQPYRFERGADNSSYIRYVTDEGKLGIVWARDAGKFVRLEQIKVGTLIRGDLTESKPVTVTNAAVRDAEGKGWRRQPIDTVRNHWRLGCTRRAHSKYLPTGTKGTISG
jgi:hypothetical protein